ncbi:multiheme c-type cytochrome [Halobaculum halobium]|uniref:Multiheme c-type cytochrome n=1 Tax=Halobaculum halobium TaxID=3032281 RepID=A0ABD5TCK3_9EURY
MEPGPPPPGLPDWRHETCASCHPAEAEAWARSGHATARTNFVFQRALTEERPDWCVRCHAPLAAPLASKDGASPPSREAPPRSRV